MMLTFCLEKDCHAPERTRIPASAHRGLLAPSRNRTRGKDNHQQQNTTAFSFAVRLVSILVNPSASSKQSKLLASTLLLLIGCCLDRALLSIIPVLCSFSIQVRRGEKNSSLVGWMREAVRQSPNPHARCACSGGVGLLVVASSSRSS